jgi:predicted nicotinamide N-methyase
MPTTDPSDSLSRQQITVQAAGRAWILERPADLESLWQSMDEAAPGAEDHIPYWVEHWPATLALCDWLARQDLSGHACLDLGCGLGLSALVASSLGAKVRGWTMNGTPCILRPERDPERRPPTALAVHGLEQPRLRPPVFRPHLGRDVFYEQRFFEPIERLLLRCLAPGGKVWFGDPERSVSNAVWPRFVRRGWRVANRGQTVVPFEQTRMTVNVWELSRPADI